ncbi:BlaI/MecI/CopY family transcriptional regulator [Fulvivirga sp. M361]|nr:BlaI/MecI/CopY family transcriptional regulator [Fulvivirga sp. M361]
MWKDKLSELEEFILLTVIILKYDAYSIPIKCRLEKTLGKKLSISTVQTCLKRLEKKGFLNSVLGITDERRFGKRKRMYIATPYAHAALSEMKTIRFKRCS